MVTQAKRRVSAVPTWALARRTRGRARGQVAQAIQLGIEYDPQPPFDSRLAEQGSRPDRGAAAPAPAASPFRSAGLKPPGSVSAGAKLVRPGPARRRAITCDSEWPSSATTPMRSSARWQALWAAERTWEVSTVTAGSRGTRSRPGADGAPDPEPPAPTSWRCSPTRAGAPHRPSQVLRPGDAIAHYHRRLGSRVLHPMGYDAFGLPAENHAIRTGVHPRVSIAESVASFQEQFRSWGISIDWSRELST